MKWRPISLEDFIDRWVKECPRQTPGSEIREIRQFGRHSRDIIVERLFTGGSDSVWPVMSVSLRRSVSPFSFLDGGVCISISIKMDFDGYWGQLSQYEGGLPMELVPALADMLSRIEVTVAPSL